MVKLWVVFVLVAIALCVGASPKQFRCTMEPDRSCSLNANIGPDDIISTTFTSPNPSTLTKVQFSRSSLTGIPPAMFQTFPKLETLNATACEIRQILSNNFAAAKSLHELHLRGNKIPNLPEEAFFGANRLRTLDLSDNAITLMETGSFKRLRGLNNLLLGGNLLSDLPSSVFDDLSELESLDLQRNKLTSIGSEQFRDCPSLTKLNVSYNALKTFDLTQIQRRWVFEVIDVSHNHLSSVTIPSNLRELVAIGNGLRTVNSDVVNGTELILLKVPHNKLTSMDHIPTFKKLISLDLSYNKIRTFDFRSVQRFGKLMLLKLDGNQMETISNGLTEPITHLKYVHLADNRFTQLNLDILRTVPRIIKLDLRRNQLHQLTVTDLADSFPVMVKLMLDGNQLSCADNRNLLKELKSSITAYALTLNDCHKGQNIIDGLCCWPAKAP